MNSIHTLYDYNNTHWRSHDAANWDDEQELSKVYNLGLIQRQL